MKKLTLKQIETERRVLLRRITVDRAAMEELNRQRQNIIMSQEE